MNSYYFEKCDHEILKITFHLEEKSHYVTYGGESKFYIWSEDHIVEEINVLEIGDDSGYINFQRQDGCSAMFIFVPGYYLVNSSKVKHYWKNKLV